MLVDIMNACRAKSIEMKRLADLCEICERQIPLAPKLYSGIRYTDMPTGTNDTTAALCAKLDGYENIYSAVRSEYIHLSGIIETALKSLEPEEASVIRMYYLEAKIDIEIGYTFNLDRRRAGEVRQSILEKIEAGY